MIRVPEEVTHASISLPINLRKGLRIGYFQPYNSLSKNLNLSFDGSSCFLVSLVRRKIHILKELVDQVDAFQNVVEVLVGVDKRQELPR